MFVQILCFHQIQLLRLDIQCHLAIFYQLNLVQICFGHLFFRLLVLLSFFQQFRSVFPLYLLEQQFLLSLFFRHFLLLLYYFPQLYYFRLVYCHWLLFLIFFFLLLLIFFFCAVGVGVSVLFELGATDWGVCDVSVLFELGAAVATFCLF